MFFDKAVLNQKFPTPEEAIIRNLVPVYFRHLFLGYVHPTDINNVTPEGWNGIVMMLDTDILFDISETLQQNYEEEKLEFEDLSDNSDDDKHLFVDADFVKNREGKIKAIECCAYWE